MHDFFFGHTVMKQSKKKRKDRSLHATVAFTSNMLVSSRVLEVK